MITLNPAHVEEMCAHAREVTPSECCGLIGGVFDENNRAVARTIYRLRNIARDASVEYEAAPEDLFAAQRTMRERGETLVAIYHSHPRAVEPVPSPTDVERAFYPSAIYFIVGLGAKDCVLRAFRLYETEKRWEQVAYQITKEDWYKYLWRKLQSFLARVFRR